MKTALLLAILAIALLPFERVNSQERHCGSHELLQHQLASNPDMARRQQQLEQFTEGYVRNFKRSNQKTTTGPVFKIPVVFHVVYNTQYGEYDNISDAQVQSAIVALNNDFQKNDTDLVNVPTAFQSLVADCEIEFCLATRDPNGGITNGIIHKLTSKTIFNPSTNDIKFSATGGDDAWPSDRYLNIWTAPNLMNYIAGYAQFPGGPAETDGIVLQHAWVGTIGSAQAPWPKGELMAHECGHWLNLRHIWGDDGTSCNGSDLVDDTPNQAGPNGGCPTFPKLSCQSGSNPQGSNGEMFMNFLDNTGCLLMFTHGQKARMHAVLAPGNPRYVLLSSPACTPVPTSCGAPEYLTAKDITSSGAHITWWSVPLSVDYTVSWKVSGSGSWLGSATVSGNSYLLSGLSASTAYEYEVAVNCQDLNTYSSTGTFTTLSSCTDIYESNNSVNAAAQIPVSTDVFARIGSSSDVDWFKFANTASTPNFSVSLTDLPANYDLYIYKPNKNSLAGSSTNSGTANETVVYNNNTAGTYYVKVVGSGGATSQACYNLRVDLSANNFVELQPLVVHENDQASFYPNPAGNEVTIRYFARSEGPADIALIDQTGRIARSLSVYLQQGENNALLDISDIPGGLYYVKITTAAGNTISKLTVRK